MSALEQNQIYLVIGGEGFLGRAIVEALVSRREKSGSNDIVRVLDLRRNFEDSRVEFYQGDITKTSDVEKALTANGRTANTVFHTASPVMKAPEALHAKVNIEGT
ncbi:hypothetical protein GGI05_002561, partial [Coemansia sp. RSA 2603]